jgi:hypothetical protein
LTSYQQETQNYLQMPSPKIPSTFFVECLGLPSG